MVSLLSPDDMMLQDEGLLFDPRLVNAYTSTSDPMNIAETGAMMMPLSAFYEMTGNMPNPMGEGYLPSTAELIRRGDYEGLGYQLLGASGDALYAASPLFPFLAAPASTLKATRASKLAENVAPEIGGKTGLTQERKMRLEKEARKLDDVDVNDIYTPLKNRGDMENLDVRQSDLGLLSERLYVTPEELMGRGLLPFYGDRSSTGKVIEGYGDVELTNPVVTYGGKDYMRQPDRVWASGDNIIDRLMTATDKAIEQGVDPVGVYIPMKGDAVDFATMAFDTFISALPRSSISAKDIKNVNEELRKIDKDFVGLQSNRLYDYVMNDINGTTRSKLLKRMAKKDLQELGLPEIGQIRRALTDEELVSVPSGFGGQAIADLRGGLLDVPRLRNTHPTYPKVGNTEGGYIGGFLNPYPQTIMFRNIADTLMDDAGNYYLNRSGKTMSDANLKRSIETKLQPQIVDDQMLEEINYFDSILGRF